MHSSTNGLIRENEGVFAATTVRLTTTAGTLAFGGSTDFRSTDSRNSENFLILFIEVVSGKVNSDGLSLRGEVSNTLAGNSESALALGVLIGVLVVLAVFGSEVGELDLLLSQGSSGSGSGSHEKGSKD